MIRIKTRKYVYTNKYGKTFSPGDKIYIYETVYTIDKFITARDLSKLYPNVDFRLGSGDKDKLAVVYKDETGFSWDYAEVLDDIHNE